VNVELAGQNQLKMHHMANTKKIKHNDLLPYFIMDEKDLAKVFSNLADIYNEYYKDYDKALEYFEKSLEEHDQQTQENSIQLITDVFSHYVDSGIANLQDIIEFSTKHPGEYFQKIEDTKLFVSQGSEPGESIKEALENYKAEIRQWRTKDWCDKLFSKGDVSVVTYAIFERIMPNYHLLENSDELRSHPFLCVNAQAHYYQLIASMKNSSVSEATPFDPSTLAILQSLTSKRLDYLANIEDSQLVALRKTNENIEFRRELRDLVNSLPNAKLEDLGYVASEICSHIERAISKHEKQVSLFNSKYQARHVDTASSIAFGTLGVTMFPVLAPFLGALLPLGGVAAIATGKYVSDKLNQNAEGKQFSHSMMGVISLAKGK
jgi:tetratricopeptide (TPR) repeat protein